MKDIFYGIDENITMAFNKQETYKKDKKIAQLYKSTDAPLIWDYDLEIFVTYLPFLLEYEKEYCNPREIISKTQQVAYMNSSRNGWTVIPEKKDIIIDYIDNYIINKYQGSSFPSYKDDNKTKFKKYFAILTDEQMKETFNEIIDNDKGLRYRITSSLQKYTKNNTVIIKKSRYSSKMDYRHIQENLYVKEQNINIKIE